MTTTVRDNAERQCYELVIDGAIVGFADYRLRGGTMVLPHTVIDPKRRGEGLGAILVRGALDDIRARGLTVDPQCWYVAEFIDGHQEYAALTEDR